MKPTIEQLWDIEAIKQLKARYFRYIDTKDWDAFSQLFTEDCVHHLPQESAKTSITNDEYLRDMKVQLGTGCHHPSWTYAGDHTSERHRGRGDMGDVRLRGSRTPFRSDEDPGLRPLL